MLNNEWPPTKRAIGFQGVFEAHLSFHLESGKAALTAGNRN